MKSWAEMNRDEKTKGLAGVLVLGLILYAVISTSITEPKDAGAPAPAVETAPQFTEAQLQAALTAVSKEPQVVSAAWNSKDIPSLLVGVRDDGSRRDGYGEYICMVLADHGIKGGVVRVMDNFSKDWRELGKVWCPR